MKIISKYKDYYDYLMGIYGVDEKIVLDRTEFGTPDFYSPRIVTFYIAGKCIDGYWDGNVFYFGDDLRALCTRNGKKPSHYAEWMMKWRKEAMREAVTVYNGEWRNSFQLAYPNFEEDRKKINEKHGCPIMCSANVAGDFIKFPKLEGLGIAGAIPPHEIYMELSSWLAPKDRVNDNMTDTEKIIAAGFDKKTSFRNIK